MRYVLSGQHPSQALIARVSEQLIESGTCFAGTPDDVYNQIKALNDSVGGFGNLLMCSAASEIAPSTSAMTGSA